MAPGNETFSPFINPLEKGALIALHVMAEEAMGGDGLKVPELGEKRKMGCQNGPMWESEGEAWSEDESVSSSGSREGNVCNDALHVIGWKCCSHCDMRHDATVSKHNETKKVGHDSVAQRHRQPCPAPSVHWTGKHPPVLKPLL